MSPYHSILQLSIHRTRLSGARPEEFYQIAHCRGPEALDAFARLNDVRGIAVERDPAARIEPRVLRPAREYGVDGPGLFVREGRQKRRQIVYVRVPICEGRTEAVLLRVALHGGLDHAQHGELVASKSPHERLNGHPSGLEDRAKRRSPGPSRRAVDMHRPLARRHAALLQYDLVALDSAHVTEADNVLDPAENPKLGLADHRATEHRRSDAGIDAKEELLGFEARKKILD